MIVYSSKTFTSRLAKPRLIDVTCEKCNCKYCYMVVRRVATRRTAAYGIREDKALNNAQVDAQNRVNRLLATAVEPVACPDCGWFQSDMVEVLRRRKTNWLMQAAFLVGLIAVVGATVCFLTWSSTGAADSLWLGIALSVVAGILPVAAGVLRKSLLMHFDPNHAYPARPEAVADAPVAVKPAEMATVPAEPTADSGLTYERQNPDALPGGWIGVQLMTVIFPPLCVRCAQPTSRRRDVPTRYGDFSVPSCKECDKNKAAATRFFAVLAGSLLGLVVLPSILKATDKLAIPGFVLLGLIASVAGMIGAYFATSGIGRPMWMRRFSAFRNTVQFRFANPAYQRPFIAVNRASAVAAAAGLNLVRIREESRRNMATEMNDRQGSP
jgi:hypothetical protein